MGKSVAIYSALAGHYDNIQQPKVIDERFDYVLFSNEIEAEKVGVWQIRKIDYYNQDTTRICRYVKTHPEELLPEYKLSVWMDSNIQICDSYIYDRVLELYKAEELISSMWHPTGCIYQEAYNVMDWHMEHEEVAVKWCHHIRQEGYPRYNGLCETNVLYRVHSDRKISTFDTEWWRCIDANSRRDQLSYNYVLWKQSLPCHYLMGVGVNVRNSEHFSICLHKDSGHNIYTLAKDEAWVLRYYWKYPEIQKRVIELYYRIYAFPFPQLCLNTIGQLLRIKTFVKRIFTAVKKRYRTCKKQNL